jgi:hypothetical protein
MIPQNAVHRADHEALAGVITLGKPLELHL